jgi:hypothetical protein
MRVRRNVYHRVVRVRGVRRFLVIVCMAAIAIAGTSCSNLVARQYEYDEQTYLSTDGSATVVISASVAALVTLRGLPFDAAPSARLDSDDVRRVFEGAGCDVERASRPWRRDGRRFVQARLRVADVRQASACGALAWSTYQFDVSPEQIHFIQTVGTPTGVRPAGVAWDGQELVAFKLHLPSRVTYQNVRRLSDGEPGTVERGNILTWEQRLSDRMAGTPIVMEVRTEAESILYKTVTLFAGAFAAAVMVLIALIWYTVRRGRTRLKTFTN